ncbi:UNVERIFIED_CONTAM: hypothetical protein FKN15_028643 [Acipenser sinensis]
MLGLDVCEFGGQLLELMWLTVCYRGIMADKEAEKPIGEEEETDLNYQPPARIPWWPPPPHSTGTEFRSIMADKEAEKPVGEEEETDLNYQPPAQKSLQEIQELDKEDESLNKYKQALLGAGPVIADPSVPNVQVTRLTLVCDKAPAPITMDLTGVVIRVRGAGALQLQHGITLEVRGQHDYRSDLEALKKQNFVLMEGVDYKVKIHFKVNKEIVSGLKYVHHTYRKGIRVDKAVYMVGSYGPRVEEHEFMTPVEEAPKGMLVRGGYHIKSYFTDDDKTDHLSWEWNLNIKKEWTD